MGGGTPRNFSEVTIMSFAEDMTDLRQRIDALRDTRSELSDRLHRFRHDLTAFRNDFAENMSTHVQNLRRSLAEQASCAETARREFVDNNREIVKQLRTTAAQFIEDFRTECSNARRAFHGGGSINGDRATK